MPRFKINQFQDIVLISVRKLCLSVDYKVMKVFAMAWCKGQSLSSERVMCLPCSIVNCSSVFIFIS